MAERSWIVGSLSECDIRVENSAVSGRHCRLTQRGESLLLEDLGSTNGTFVAGERISSPRIVRRGDPVTLGRNTPLPWPPVVRSVTIGRLPDNDIVIPLDMVSGQHARLEQEGNTVYLVDLGSTNGTAVNDPLNKITRAAIQPADQVFLGSHRVAGWELFKALPRQVERPSTVLESPASAELERELTSAGGPAARKKAAALAPQEPIGSRSSWAWGLGLSALCATLILGGAWMLGSGQQEVGGTSTTAAPDNADSAVTPLTLPTPADVQPPGEPPTRDATSSQKGPATVSLPPVLEESVVRRSQDALGLIGIRIDSVLVVSTATVWACQPDAVICPTAILELLESKLVKGEGHDETVVVCTPTKTLAILKHTPGRGAAEGFSLAKLEGPLEVACKAAEGGPPPQPGQQLMMLTCTCAEKDKPASMERKLHVLKIDRIERAADKSPRVLRCTADSVSGDVQGSPVFDATGTVVGCARPSADGVEVVPLARLSELLPANP